MFTFPMYVFFHSTSFLLVGVLFKLDEMFEIETEIILCVAHITFSLKKTYCSSLTQAIACYELPSPK